MSILINGLIKWRDEKMERAGAGLTSQWQRRTEEGREGKWVEVSRVTGGGVGCGSNCEGQIPMCP